MTSNVTDFVSQYLQFVVGDCFAKINFLLASLVTNNFHVLFIFYLASLILLSKYLMQIKRFNKTFSNCPFNPPETIWKIDHRSYTYNGVTQKQKQTSRLMVQNVTKI